MINQKLERNLELVEVMIKKILLLAVAKLHSYKHTRGKCELET